MADFQIQGKSSDGTRIQFVGGESAEVDDAVLAALSADGATYHLSRMVSLQDGGPSHYVSAVSAPSVDSVKSE